MKKNLLETDRAALEFLSNLDEGELQKAILDVGKALRNLAEMAHSIAISAFREAVREFQAANQGKEGK